MIDINISNIKHTHTIQMELLSEFHMHLKLKHSFQNLNEWILQIMLHISIWDYLKLRFKASYMYLKYKIYHKLQKGESVQFFI